MKTLQDLFLDQLADIYYAERQLTKALPKMAKAAAHQPLREAIEAHLDETEDHVRRVELAFHELEETPRAKKCQAILGLLKEGEEMVDEHKEGPSLDAAIIAAAQKVEHYEIATYGCLVEWANQLRLPAVSDLLDEILEEEKAADIGLTMLARSLINESADDASGDDDAEGEEEAEVGKPSVRKHAGSRQT